MMRRMQALLAVVLVVLISPAAVGAGELDIPMIPIPGKGYEIGKTEVTQGQWQAVMGNNPSFFKECGANCPVERVSWNDAQAFIAKLNARTGKQYRLPTYGEWWYACRAGGRHQKYCGDDIMAIAWLGANSNNSTHPVASKRPNAWGIHDMNGNVSEWLQDKAIDCVDGYALFQKEEKCAWYSLMGGSWYDETAAAMISELGDINEVVRRNDYFGYAIAPAIGFDYNDIDRRGEWFGFRLARTTP